MDPMQAVQYLDQIVAQAPMNRAQHIQAIRASSVIRSALPAAEKPVAMDMSLLSAK